MNINYTFGDRLSKFGAKHLYNFDPTEANSIKTNPIIEISWAHFQDGITELYIRESNVLSNCKTKSTACGCYPLLQVLDSENIRVKKGA